MHISAVRIFVSNLVAARDFYAQVLGLTLEYDGSTHGYCKFRSRDLQVIVEHVPPHAPEEDQVLVGRFLGLSFAVADVDAEYKRLVALGCTFTGPPETQPWGGRLATLQDTSLNEVQLVQYPASAA